MSFRAVYSGFRRFTAGLTIPLVGENRFTVGKVNPGRRSPPVVWTCRARRRAGFPPAQSLSFPSGGGERRGDGLRVPSSEGPLRPSRCMRLASASGFCQLCAPHAGRRRQRRSLPRVYLLAFFLRGISPCFCLPLGSLPSCAPPPAGCAHRRRCTPEGRYLAWHTLHRRFAPSSDKSSREGNTR